MIDRDSANAGPPSWTSLGPGARLFRVAHTVWSVFNLAALAHIWRCAVTRRRDRYLYWAVGLLLTEGGALVVGRGDCPFGPFQAHLGDPVPLFELVLSPRAAKAAVPVLAAASIVGLAAVLLRPTTHSICGPRARTGDRGGRPTP